MDDTNRQYNVGGATPVGDESELPTWYRELRATIGQVATPTRPRLTAYNREQSSRWGWTNYQESAFDQS